MAFCSMCGAQIPDGATVCPACSGRTATVPATAPLVATTGAGLADNVAGMLAYVTIIPAIIFLVIEPYNRSRFVRFHSFQSIFFGVAVFVIQVGLSVMTVVPLLIFITGPLHLLVALGAFIVWIILLIKANQGQMYKLPVIGDLAEKQAG
ncbi:MAG: DUF4870 domain-containing protein [Candidatus Sulfotelmatobacter sp.]